jgi:hypothetical protein
MVNEPFTNPHGQYCQAGWLRDVTRWLIIQGVELHCLLSTSWLSQPAWTKIGMCLPYNFHPINDNDLLAIYESMMIQLLQRDFDQQNCDSIGKTLRLSTFIKAGTGKALIFPAWDGHGLLFEVGIARAPLQSAAL